MSKRQIEEQARNLAKEYLEADPSITAAYWFPNDDEVRLVEIDEDVPISPEGVLQPFYFRASERHQLYVPFAIAIIQPSEFRKLRLPENWGTWNDAVLLEPEQ